MIKKLIAISFALMLSLQTFPPVKASSADAIYAAPSGNDSSPGTMAQPVKTINRALALAAENNISSVILRGGEYDQSEESVRITKSGITLSSYEGERAVIVGAKKLSADSFALSNDSRIPASAQGMVYEADLSQLYKNEYAQKPFCWITAGNVSAPAELFVKDEKTTVARWPNSGWAYTGETENALTDINSLEFKTSASVQNWQNAYDAMAIGYFRLDYAYDAAKIDSVNAENSTVKLLPTYNGQLSRGMISNRRYYVYNLLEELDTAGEYYIDSRTKKLFYYPGGTMEDKQIYLSVNEEPLVSIAHGTSNVTIENITLCNTRGDAVAACDEIEGVSQNFENNQNYPDSVTNIKLRGLDIHNTGKRAIALYGAKGCTVQSCNLSDTGSSAVFLAGGQQNSLTSSETSVVNCDIQNAGRRERAYSGGIYLRGTGFEIKNNYLHDIAHSAIFFFGSENKIKQNRIYRSCYECYDSGAIYTGGSRVWWGNEIEENIIRGVRNHLFDKETANVHCIYLDDLMCGVSIKKNIFADCHNAVNSGGGRNNVFEGNIVLDASKGVLFAERALAGLWYRSVISAEYMSGTSSGTAYYKLHSFIESLTSEQKEMWFAKYPGLSQLYEESVRQNNAIKNYIEENQITGKLSSKPQNATEEMLLSGVPKGCSVSGNIFAGANVNEDGYNKIAQSVSENGSVSGNAFYENIQSEWFNDYLNGDYTVNNLPGGFTAPNVGSIGTYTDEWRLNTERNERQLLEHKASGYITESFSSHTPGTAVQPAFEMSAASKTGLYSALVQSINGNNALALKSNANENGNDTAVLRFTPLNTTNGIVSVGFSLSVENMSRDLSELSLVGYNENEYDKDIKTERFILTPGNALRVYGTSSGSTNSVIADYAALKSGFVKIRIDLDYQNQAYSVYRYDSADGAWVCAINARPAAVAQYIDRIRLVTYTGNGANYLNKGVITQEEYSSPTIFWIDDIYTGAQRTVIESAGIFSDEIGLNFKGSVFSTYNEDKPACAIAAVYGENGALIEARKLNVTLTTGGNLLNIPFENTGASAALYVFEDEHSLKPAAECVKTKIH